MAHERSKAPQTAQDREQARRRNQAACKPAISEESRAVAEPATFDGALERHAAVQGGSRLGHPANAVRRAGIDEYVQRTYGNEHVQRVIRQVRVQRVLGKGSGLSRAPLRPNPFGPGVEQEGGAQTPTTGRGGFAPEAAARIRHEIMSPIEEAAGEALTASPPDTVRAMRLISQAIYAVASAPLEQRFARSTAAAMRHEVMTPLEEAGELLSSGGSAEQAMTLLARAIAATASLRLESGAR